MEMEHEHPPGDREQNQRDLGTNRQYCLTHILAKKKKTSLFSYHLVTILKMHFSLYYSYLITYLQDLVGAHCSIYTFTILRFVFIFS